MLENCAVCSVTAKKLCSACHQVKYCSVEHQKQHWRTHKKVCRPYRVAEDAELGRYLVATQNITAEQVIFIEQPIVVGPKWYQNDTEQESFVVPCIACYKPCRLGKHLCPSCRWPVCSELCAAISDTQEHKLECMVLSLGPGPSYKSDIRDLHNYYRYDAVLVLRCLLLQRQQNNGWTDLLELQSHLEDRLDTELYADAERRIISYLEQNFMRHLKSIEQKTKDKFLKEYDTVLMHRICGIIETNCMCIQLATGIELSGIFRMACMMEHACQPNCYFQFDPQHNYKISVIAGCNIKKGEHLKISYTNILWGTQLRHHHLNMTKHFRCKCERCSDPTEYGSYISALRCLGDELKICNGLQLPIEPLSENSDWKCDTCPVIVNSNDVAGILSRMAEEVDLLIERKPDYKEIEDLLERLSTFLHPNHYHMFNLKHTLIQIYGGAENLKMPQLTDQQLKRKLSLCKQLQDICLKLDPYVTKLSIYMAIILHELARGLKEQTKRQLKHEPEAKAQALLQLQQVSELLTQAMQMLRKELDSVTGKKLNEQLEQETLKLDRFILACQL